LPAAAEATTGDRLEGLPPAPQLVELILHRVDLVLQVFVLLIDGATRRFGLLPLR
jgi:hypothetical protein